MRNRHRDAFIDISPRLTRYTLVDKDAVTVKVSGYSSSPHVIKDGLLRDIEG